MQRNGVVECSVCRSRVVVPSPRSVSRAYDKHRNKMSSKFRALNVFLVVGDCILVGLQPILVFMSKVDGKFQFSPISVNFLTEVMKVIFAVVMLIIQSRKQKVGEKPLLARSTFIQAARNNVLLAVPALLYAINNYLKFIMQLYFNPATVKMLSNLKVLVIAFLLKFIMRRRFSVIQWEALALLLIGISINQLRTVPVGNTAFGLPVTAIAYIYIDFLASVYNEYALKSQYDTSIYLQNLFLYGYGAIFNLLGILGTVLFQDDNEKYNFVWWYPHALQVVQKKDRHNFIAYGQRVLIFFEAIQGPQYFSYVTMLHKAFYLHSSLSMQVMVHNFEEIFVNCCHNIYWPSFCCILGHSLTINFLLGISVVFISMHQFFSPLAKVKDDKPADSIELEDTQNDRPSESSFVNMTAGAADDASHRIGTDERQPLLPI
ncbi:hypothetical protein Zm00014a_026671 [Zea mays]|uniref:CMP-sialic acid transporter 5 n=1 Tax=Zea mays TaxID=4577 RepID=A0A3L6F2F0_MAIZE|nr:CMP-sialic acid transporter 5 [Zea mays]PWZ27483.1 hypothetical protein Zm00014a_026671 [Zea mays]